MSWRNNNGRDRTATGGIVWHPVEVPDRETGQVLLPGTIAIGDISYTHIPGHDGVPVTSQLPYLDGSCCQRGIVFNKADFRVDNHVGGAGYQYSYIDIIHVPITVSGGLDLDCSNIIDVGTMGFCENIVITQPDVSSIAIGYQAGGAGINNQGTQKSYSIAIGNRAGETDQSANSVAIGYQAGNEDQSSNAIAIGTQAGETGQGGNSIAIGNLAGGGVTHENSIILNATGAILDSTTVGGGFYVKPIPERHEDDELRYNRSSGAITSQPYTPHVIFNGDFQCGTPAAAISDGAYDMSTIWFCKDIVLGTVGTDPGVAIGRNAGGMGIIKGGGPSLPADSVAIGNQAGAIAQATNSIAIGLLAGATQGASSVAIGDNAGKERQQDYSVAIGYQAGLTDQSNNSVAIGRFAGQKYQEESSVAIGYYAGQMDQHVNSVAIGHEAGQTDQSKNSVAVGYSAGKERQHEYSVAIGYQAGQTDQSDNSVAIGNQAGVTQGRNSVAIGRSAGNDTQEEYSVAIGNQAGQNDQTFGSVAIGYFAGQTEQGKIGGLSVAIGYEAGKDTQGYYSVATGPYAGQTRQREYSVAIGYQAGLTDQSINSVAIGRSAGETQGQGSVAIGHLAGYDTQGNSSVAIGSNAGQIEQGNHGTCIAIGSSAGKTDQYGYSIALGFNAGFVDQSANSVAIGRIAGMNYQSQDSVAIGYNAGQQDQSYNCVAVGANAGNKYQQSGAVALGKAAGYQTQGEGSVAVGNRAAGHTVNGQGATSVAVGYYAGYDDQDSSAVAVGTYAGYKDQSANSVAIGNSAGYSSQDTSSVAIGPYAGSSSQGVIGQPYEDVITIINGVWNSRATAGGTGGNWSGYRKSIVSNRAGDKLFAVGDGTSGGTGFPFISLDSGITWTKNTTSPGGYRVWRCIATDSAGTNLAAAETTTNSVWLSGDSGTTWTSQSIASSPPHPPTATNWHSVASNADGSVVVVCNGGVTGEIWASQNANVDGAPGGTNSVWANVSPPAPADQHSWTTITSNYDGTSGGSVQFVATSETTVDLSGRIWTSIDSGSNWLELNNILDPPAAPAGPAPWKGLCSSKTGQSLFATLNGGNIWRSQDYGLTTTWSALTTGGIPLNQNWQDIACDDTGTNVVAGGSGGVGIWTSQDGGDTWSNTIYSPPASSVTFVSFASNEDGTILAANEYDGPIWTTVATPITRYLIGPGNSVAIGAQAGQTNQAYQSIAIGSLAGQTDQSANAIAIGPHAGQTDQGASSVAIGHNAGNTQQAKNSVAIGHYAGYSGQDLSSIAIGYYAGQTSQGEGSIAIGPTAGYSAQGPHSTAIGLGAGMTNQGDNSVALGNQAGMTNQSTGAPDSRGSIAIGQGAGYKDQSYNSVAIGYHAGFQDQSSNAIAIGTNAGSNGMGINSIYIGNQAGSALAVFDNNIVINATGAASVGMAHLGGTGRFYIDPIRKDSGPHSGKQVYYDSANKELRYDNIAKVFVIDHPIKEDYKLIHSCIEGPQIDLIYRGKIKLKDGYGEINIDEKNGMTNGTFEALCRDIQSFTTNETGWKAVRSKVIGNILQIQCKDKESEDTISWMVIGERKDKGLMQDKKTDEEGKLITEQPNIIAGEWRSSC